MYFDLDDRWTDISPLARPISWREGILLSVIVHLVLILLVILHPTLPMGGMITEEEVARQIELRRQRDRDAGRFVFVQPQLDVEAPKPPPRADLSDKNREARAPERAENPTNPMPFSRGNTPERVDTPGTVAPPQPVEQPPAGPGTRGTSPQAGSESTGTGGDAAVIVPGPPESSLKGSGSPGTGGLHGTIGEALRNLQRYVQGEKFDNPQGGAGAFGPAIQFDTKGVEFGPWVRRFVAQIKRNWFIPYAAMALKGHVVLTFYVNKDGSITELAVPGPCSVVAFNNAAYNALAASNPTYPLPREYPAPRAFFTVTFYYNEVPPRE